jgi:hypothetical protein
MPLKTSRFVGACCTTCLASRVVRKGPIIVWPGDKNGDETIREVELGAELIGYNEKFDKPGYIAIVQDDECAFIASECVERSDPLPIEVQA